MKDSQDKAREYAFLLFKFRLRSEKEIYDRLKRKKFSPDIIKTTIEFLKDKDFLNDELFASAWADSRIKRPIGLRRIKAELKAKGIAENIIENKLSELKGNYPEREIVQGLARKKFSQIKGIEPQKARRRVFEYLVRRGFSHDTITEVLRGL